MALTRSDLRAFLQEIRAFFGNDWFEAQGVKDNGVAASEKTHVVVSWWTKAKAHLEEPRPHGLNVTPMEDVLQILMLGSCLRNIAKGDVVDMMGNLSKKSPEDLFRKRLRSSEKFASAFYETQVASAYMRKGYRLSFIDDETRRSPEFVMDVDGNSVYVECKRIERRRIDKASSNLMKWVCKRVEQMLLRTRARVAVIIICPEQVSSAGIWIEQHVSELVEKRQALRMENELNGFRFIISDLPPSEVIWARQGHMQEMIKTWYGRVLDPWKQKVLGNTDTPIESSFPKVQFVGPEQAFWEMDAYVEVAFRELSNVIGGVGKTISKASRQLPENGIGVLYIECPPYDASDQEMEEFRRTVIGKLNRISRINGIVLTGTVHEVNSIKHISNLIVNHKSGRPLPNGFQIVPLVEQYTFGS
jgi:hypothetical protein